MHITSVVIKKQAMPAAMPKVLASALGYFDSAVDTIAFARKSQSLQQPQLVTLICLALSKIY